MSETWCSYAREQYLLCRETFHRVNELEQDNERLRELLRKCKPYVENYPVCDTRLCDAVEREVGEDE